MANLKESVWYNTLSPNDIEALERCIEYQQEIDEHERQQEKEVGKRGEVREVDYFKGM